MAEAGTERSLLLFSNHTPGQLFLVSQGLRVRNGPDWDIRSTGSLDIAAADLADPTVPIEAVALVLKKGTFRYSPSVIKRNFEGSELLEIASNQDLPRAVVTPSNRPSEVEEALGLTGRNLFIATDSPKNTYNWLSSWLIGLELER